MNRIFNLLLICLLSIPNFAYPQELSIDTFGNQKSILTDHQILTDSTIKYDFGYGCYFSGSQPKGIQSINDLIRRNDIQTIRPVLDGHNNEGKVYAIEALLLLGSKKEIRLDRYDKSKIRLIIKQNFSVNRCQGCFVSTIKSTKLFNESYFKKLLKKKGVVE